MLGVDSYHNCEADITQVMKADQNKSIGLVNHYQH
jgi:hypothetical protein